MESAGRRRRREDRISKLGDGALGCILSFLPPKEAARAAALSSPWCHAFAGVHAISLEEPDPDENPTSAYVGEQRCCCYGNCDVDHDEKPRFANAVTAALLARHRRSTRPRRCCERSTSSWTGTARRTPPPWTTGSHTRSAMQRLLLLGSSSTSDSTARDSALAPTGSAEKRNQVVNAAAVHPPPVPPTTPRKTRMKILGPARCPDGECQILRRTTLNRLRRMTLKCRRRMTLK
jgi:hypothetical protein